MKKLLHSFLSANRKRRNMAVISALWVLRLVRDVEKDELYRCEDRLYKLDNMGPDGFSLREYTAAEEECSNCEYALGVLDCAIEDLGLEYCAGRF